MVDRRVPGPLDSQAAHDRWWRVEDFRVEHEKQLAVDLALAGDNEYKVELAIYNAAQRLKAHVNSRPA